VLSDATWILAIIMAKKSCFNFFKIKKLVFQSIFNQKHLKNYDKPINDIKRPKKHQNQPKTKNHTEFKSVFLKNLK